MSNYILKNKNKYKTLIIFALLCMFSLFLKDICTNKIVSAEGGWAIGENGTIGKDPTPTSYGATAWPIGNGILISTQTLPKYADKNGRDKIIKEVDSLSPDYTDKTVAIIPYELHKYMDNHNYDSIYVVKRADTGGADLQKKGKPEYTGAVIRMETNPETIDLKKETYIRDGIFYEKLRELSGNTSKKALTGKKWKDVLKKDKNNSIKQCKVLWSYLTLVKNNKYDVTGRIDQYLHSEQLIGNNYNDLSNVHSDKMREFEFRYLDFLITIYTMCDSNSKAVNHWEGIIDEYVKGLEPAKPNKCNVIISPSVAARGEIEKNKYYNIIAGCQDYLDFTMGIDRNWYSLGKLDTAETVEESLEKSKKGTNYYNRLLESIRLSLVYQSKNHIKVNRTYTGSGLFASNVVSRLIDHKPIINGTSVSYKSANWSQQRIIENISLKDKYFGLALVPAIDGSTPGYKAKLTVGSTKPGYEGQKRVPIYNEAVLNDSSKITINLESEKNDEWKRIFKNYKYYKVQVKMTRTPASPAVSLEPKTYITKPDKISGKELESILLNSEKPLHQWIDTSLNGVPINEKEIKKYTYKAEVTIYYSNTTETPAEMESIAVETNSDSITYEKKETKLYASYVSEPDAYSELKEGGIYNETFEAMAGVPTTRKLYFASGGSEFMVEVEVMYDKDKTAERTYRSYFKGGVDCEFKEGDTAKPQSLGGQSADLHNGGTYTKTWTGSIPNTASPASGTGTVTCSARPDRSAYNSAKAEAAAFAAEVNGTTLSYTSASDKKTRSKAGWNASITTDSPIDPVDVTESKYHTETRGTPPDTYTVEVPDPVTASPSGPGSYTITVTWTVPAHIICGPCCSHVLNSVEDTWTQKSSFDTLKITDVRVWKIDSSYVGGMEEITYDADAFVKATVKQGDPNIFYNVAATDTSKAGRLRYSLQQQQHDVVTWYETSDIGESRSNKCDGQSGTLCSQNPMPVAKNQGHLNSWSKGILYNNTTYANDVDHHKVSSGTKSTVTNNSTDSIDKGTLEYIRFNERRNQENTMTVISDMLILQTSSGDQSVIYFDTKQTKKAQVNFDNIEVKFEEMWKDNRLSASNWKENSINIGSYNGKYNQTTIKYEGTGGKEQIKTAFDNDAAKTTSGDELGKARVVSSMSFTSGSANKSSPSAGQARMTRPNSLRIFIDKIRQNPINPNKEYFTGQSYVYYRNILSLTDTQNTIKLAVAHNDELTTNDMGDYGYTIKSRYRITDSKEGNVNSIVVQNPVSVEDARIVSLPDNMDQRATIPEGSAKDLLQEIAASQVCPLSPGLCEFRKLNCNYFSESVKASFDFEKVSTLELADSNHTEEDGDDNSDTEEIIQDQLVFQDFETNDYGITAKNNCNVSTSKERLVVEVTGKDSSIEIPVNFYSSGIVSAKVYFGTSGSSKTSKMYWEGTKNSSSVNTVIEPETINQTAIFNLNTLDKWKQAGKITKIKFNFDGDNTGDGVYIISKIELIQQGSTELEDGIYTGSEDDKTIIRSLIKTASGETMDYGLPTGFSIAEGSSNGFGSGRYLYANGKRLPIELSGLGLAYDKNLRVKVESNLYIPGISSSNRMLFSFHNLGFYIPSGQTYGAFTTGNGVEKKANCNLIGTKVKLGIVFSFGNIADCEIYINGQKLDNYSTVNTSNSIDEDVIGDSVYLGCWSKNDSYISDFYLDNLTITRMPGTNTHTASCYTTIKEHSYTKQYTCNSKLELNHVHNDSCTYRISQDNTHVHTADCFDIDENALQVAYDKAIGGETELIENMLGDNLFREFENSMTGVKKDFEYTGSVQFFTAPVTGYYMLETWGAEGGKGDGGINPAGLGGYSKGTIKLAKGQTVQVYVGEYGGLSPNKTPAFNGGGASFDNTGHNGGRGGGATDIRIGGKNIIERSISKELGRFYNETYLDAGVTRENLGNENVIKIAKGSMHKAAALPNTLSTGHNYVITFEAWSTTNNDELRIDAYPDTLPELAINLTSNRQLYTVNISSNLAEMNNAALRFFVNSKVNIGDIYITNVRVYDTTLITDHSSRIVVAGGGGGAMPTCGGTAATAGHGGGIEGVHSENTAGTYVGNIAYGGTQTAGGSYRPGATNYAPSNGNGILGTGANAGTCGAGGGGGYYGGGTVYTAGGGGGSGYIGGVINGSMTTGVRTGNGKASITYLGMTGETDSAADFIYTGGMQTFTAPVTGEYTFEVWGAQGGYTYGGLGGYSKGTVTLTKNETIYIGVGQQGQSYNGGYNGGGYSAAYGYGGGGATHIAKATGVLSSLASNKNSVLIVAGGGGGWAGRDDRYGGAGGGLTGGTGFAGCGGAGTGGTQTSGGTSGRNGSAAGFGYGGNQTIGSSNGGAGGGGGYYGGGAGGNDYPNYHDNDDSGGGGGSGYIGGVTNGTTQSDVNSGNGKAKISWKAGKTFEDVLEFVQEHKGELPKTVNGKTNPIFKCTGIYNTHVCNESCREIKLLNCNEPHHSGQHYDYDNDICWDACGNDNNHKHSAETPVQDATGEFVKNGTFISLDNYFQVYFPNVGDFLGNNCYGISQTTTYRGKGYTDNMSTLEWTREKKVQFSYDVLFNRNGIWEQHMAGEWITLPIYDSNGREMIYYDFYCLLSNDEAIGTGVDFVVEAINCDPSPGGKEDPYLGDDSCDADCIFDIYDGYVTNKKRFSSLEAYHSAYRRTYTDIVGRIGNLIMEDTEDMRFSNLFKQSTGNNKWIIEGLLHEVDTGISKNYLAWFNNDGSYGKDIRGVTVSKKNQMYNTYGTQKWTNDAGALPFPLEADRNIITSLKSEQLKPGYNVLFDISTIGEYKSKIQTVPYFYALNTDTDTLTPIDLYIQMDGGYEPINYFGLMSEYVKDDNTYSDEYYRLKDKLYPYIMNLDWKNESLRRNYTKEEEAVTKDLATNLLEYVTDDWGNVITSKYLTIPYGENYALGTLQMLLPETRARTFIGTSKVTAVNMNGATETNIDGSIPNNYFTRSGQRWHLKLGIPSSVIYVPYRNNKHMEPTANVTLSDGTRCKAYEEIEKGNYVILMTADIKAIGNKYILGYNQGMNNGKIKVNGKTYSFGDDIPTVIAVYDGKKNSSQDVDFIGTH